MLREVMLQELNTAGVEPNWYQWDDGRGGGNNPYTYTRTHDYSMRCDVVTQHYKKKINQGMIINNLYIFYASSYFQVPSTCFLAGWWNTPTDGIRSRSNWLFPIEGEPPKPSFIQVTDKLLEYESERQVAIQKSWSKVDLSEIQALASLGELPETIKWIASIFKRFITVARMLLTKQGRLKVLKQLNKRVHFGYTPKLAANTAADAWLEWRYAIRPLIFEMKQAVTALKKVVDKAARQTGRGFNRKNVDSTDTFFLGTDPKMEITRRVTRISDYRAGVLFKIETNLNSLLNVWGLNRPLEAVWELIPFSFIIDWFFSVGDCIANLFPTAGLSPLASWITESHVIETSYVWSYASRTNPYHVTEESTTPGQSVHTQTFKVRTPTPHVAVLPQFRVKLDTSKIIDLVTIGRSFVPKGIGAPKVSKRSGKKK